MAKVEKNITAYSYETGHKFEGYRLCKNSHGTSFQKYYSVKEYGTKAKALKAAKKARTRINKIIDSARLTKGSLSKKTIAEAKAALHVAPTEVR